MLAVLSVASITYILRGVSPDDKVLIQKYSAPQEIVDVLSEHTDFFLNVIHKCSVGNYRKDFRPLVWQFDSLPGYYVKWGVGRIRGMEKIQECIDTFDLSCLGMAKKYIYHIPGRGEELCDENYWVISEEQKAADIPLVINLEVAKQVFTLIKETGFYDFQPRNIVRTSDNKLTIIDSEIRFDHDWGMCLGLRKLITSLSFNLNDNFTEDALKYIIRKLIRCYPPSRSYYSSKYYQILKYLELQPTPHSWDYVAFFKEIFPEPTKSVGLGNIFYKAI